ncbi:MAG: DUF1015 family protein [candidate division Zixibacteria bacterium]|nr:DUF1015 family protein [candidate division Zixibacteria bacterium]
MSIVRPFRGLRPKPEFASQVACPPYDVLNTQEARAMADGNPRSFLRVNKAELEFADSANPYSPDVYQRAKENLAGLERDGIMIRDPQPCFYLYRLTMDGRKQTGLVALTSVAEYDQGKIKKHEHTRPEKVNDRANHITQVAAQVGPVFSTFRRKPEIEAIFTRISSLNPLIDFTSSDQIRHELWVIDDRGSIAEIESVFSGVDALYIADGHHRSEAASEVARRMREADPHHTGRENYNFFLNVLFSDHELRILPYNRVVKDLNEHTLDELLARSAAHFEVGKTNGQVEPKEPHQFGFYAAGQWYILQSKAGSFDAQHPIESIDAAILSNRFLTPLLNIVNLRTDKRIDFVGGIRGTQELERLVNSGQFKAAFSLYPTSIEQLLRVADAGGVMPPKSTWFEPKLRDGMVVNLLTD